MGLAWMFDTLKMQNHLDTPISGEIIDGKGLNTSKIKNVIGHMQ